MDKIPVINGQNGKALVIGACAVLICLFIAVTAIIISGDMVPDFFYTTGTLLVGFLIGSRVVTPDVSKQIQENNQSTQNDKSMIGIPNEPKS